LLEETFGPEALSQMHRQTATGPVKQNLADELREMEALFHGAYVTAALQIGLTPNDAQPAGSGDVRADAEQYITWAANLSHDPDLGQDARMMVPVFYDQQRKLTKAWVFLGWSASDVDFSFARHPAARVLDKDGNPVGPDRAELLFHSTSRTIAYPIVAEVYVKRILNRDEFRRHCDLYKSRTVILDNL
jgi:hypothetical protein